MPSAMARVVPMPGGSIRRLLRLDARVVRLRRERGPSVLGDDLPHLAPGGFLVALGKHDQLDDEIVCLMRAPSSRSAGLGVGASTPGQSQVQGMAG